MQSSPAHLLIVLRANPCSGRVSVTAVTITFRGLNTADNEFNDRTVLDRIGGRPAADFPAELSGIGLQVDSSRFQISSN